MSDAELVADFMRGREVEGRTVLEVGIVEWSGAYDPSIRWKASRQWTKPPTPEQLDAARRRALDTPRYFRVCAHCGERNNAGHMFDRVTCQQCAETTLGVVY